MIGLAEPMEFYKTFMEWYISQTQVQWYLEIGCQEGWTVRRVSECPSIVHIDAVDPDMHYSTPDPRIELHHMTSDEFFAKCEHLYNIIFVDGDHSEKQVRRDIDNAVKHLTNSGLLLLHDTYPPSKSYTSADACGTAYRAIEGLDEERRDLEVFTFPVTYGLTLIRQFVAPDEEWIKAAL